MLSSEGLDLKKIHRIEEEGNHYFNFPTGLAADLKLLKIYSNFKREPGYLIKGEKIKKWKFTGLRQVENKILLYGPYYDGITLEEVLELSLEYAIPYIKELIAAWITFEKKGTPIFSVQTRQILFLKSGGILFFPIEVFNDQVSEYLTGKIVETNYAVNHPYLDGQAKLSFTIAIILYKLITESFPFSSDSKEEITDRVVLKSAISPDLLVSELKTDIAEFIGKNLQSDGIAFSTLEEWGKQLDSWGKSGYFKQVTKEEKDKSTINSKIKIKRLQKKHQRKLFWKNNKRKIQLLSIGILIFLIVSYNVIDHIMRPRKTAGFNPTQVVQIFYQSINTFDVQSMEDAVTEDAGRQKINEVIHLMVTSKMQKAYSKESTIITADQWDEQGRPELEVPYVIYGVSKIIIDEIKPIPNPIFLVSYEKWFPRYPEDQKGKKRFLTSSKLQIKEMVYLKQENEDWSIYKIIQE